MRFLATASIIALAPAILVAGCTTATDEGNLAPAFSNADCAGMTVDGDRFSAQWMPAADGLPAFCEVSGTLHPVEGSNIGVVYRLPENWDGTVSGYWRRCMAGQHHAGCGARRLC